MPAATPVTVPLVPMVATAMSELLHVPPPGKPPHIIVLPTHTDVGPVIADGEGITVTVRYAVQPEPNEYVSIAVPTLTPVTRPLVDPTDTVDDELVHKPPGTELV